MRFGIIDEESGIFTIEGVEELGGIQERRIRIQMPEEAKFDDLAFFYISDRDWIVLNRSHIMYEYYAIIVSCYLKLSAEGRRESARRAPTDTVRKALRILDDVIMRRALLYGKGRC